MCETITEVLIGKTTGNTTPFKAEIEVFNRKVRLGDFVKVTFEERDILFKVINLYWKNKGTGAKKQPYYLGTIAPVLNVAKPIPPNTEIVKAKKNLIVSTLKIGGCKNKIDLGTLINEDISVCIDQSKLTRHVAVLGQTGFGKTYTGTVILEELIPKGTTMVVIDPHGDFEILAEVFPDKISIFRFEEDIPTLDEMVVEDKTVIIPLTGIDDTMADWLVEHIVSTLFKYAKKGLLGPVFLVIDEAHRFAPQQGISMAKASIITGVKEGRKFGLGVMLLTQRPASLEKNVLSQCGTQIIHKVTNSNDVNAIATGVEGVGKEDKEMLQKQGVGEALVVGAQLSCGLYIKIKKRISPDREVQVIGVG